VEKRERLPPEKGHEKKEKKRRMLSTRQPSGQRGASALRIRKKSQSHVSCQHFHVAVRTIFRKTKSESELAYANGTQQALFTRSASLGRQIQTDRKKEKKKRMNKKI
jgi:hypothetical protein